jgi:hypothetical protein
MDLSQNKKKQKKNTPITPCAYAVNGISLFAIGPYEGHFT